MSKVEAGKPHIDAAFQALQVGAEKGLEAFYHLYYAPLTYFACKLTSNQPAAEDIVTEAFIKLWGNREKLTTPYSVKSYLYSTVRNAAIDWLRVQKRQAQHQQDIRYRSETTETAILHYMIEAETTHQLYTALESLPPKCRQVFSLFYLHSKELKEIARIMNISVTTVKSQKERAIELLRKRLRYLPLLLVLLVRLFF